MEEYDVPPQIYIMTNNDSPIPDIITEIPSEGQLELNGVDYSNNFILFVFTGKYDFGYTPGFEVTQIWQADNIIYIQANFPRWTSITVIPGFYYGNDVIKVSKDNMSQFGEITLILLDQDGKERVRTKVNIPE
jgi:hypothetical protein